MIAKRKYATSCALVALTALVSCGRTAPEPAASSATDPAAPAAPAASAATARTADGPPNPERNAYFGETHVHTSWSVDAWVIGNRLAGPDQAYRYAQGQTIKHPMGFDVTIDTPMDFMGVTDHSEYVGVTR